MFLHCRLMVPRKTCIIFSNTLQWPKFLGPRFRRHCHHEEDWGTRCWRCDREVSWRRGAKPGKLVQVPEGQVKALCVAVREVFMAQNALLSWSTSQDLRRRARPVSWFASSFRVRRISSREQLLVLEITLIAENRALRPLYFCLHTRRSTLRTFSCCEGTTSALPLQEFTVSMTSASVVTTSNSGNNFATCSIVCQCAAL